MDADVGAIIERFHRGDLDLLTSAVSVPALIEALEVAIAELGRKEAEAAALREHLHDLSKRWHWVHSGPDENEAYETCTVATCILNRHALNNVQAGAALLERVRQLEEKVTLYEAGYGTILQAGEEHNRGPNFPKDIGDAFAIASVALNTAWDVFGPTYKDQHHQGTGAAGEGD
jgi:hypothetical protein